MQRPVLRPKAQSRSRGSKTSTQRIPVVRQEQTPKTGEAVRLMLYSHDTFGLGHLLRCLKISKVLSTEHQELSILLVTGSPVVHRFQLPPRVDYVKLPSVRKVGTESYESRVLTTPYERTASLRASLLLATVKSFQPEILLVDHSPVGMKGEMLEPLRWLREHRPSCVNLLGLRDVIDNPSDVREQWRKENLYQIISECYDNVLVYGPREYFDVANSYKFPAELAEKTRYCGYVIDDLGHTGEPAGLTREAGKANIVASIGGGDGAAETVVGTLLEVFEKGMLEVPAHVTILTGPFIEPDLLKSYQRRAEKLPVQLLSFVDSTSPYFESSDLVISTGGYNTVTQILAHARRAIIIPRRMYREEQVIRAKVLSDSGWVETIHPDKVDSAQLAGVMNRLLKDSYESVSAMRESHAELLRGTAAVSNFVDELLPKVYAAREVTA